MYGCCRARARSPISQVSPAASRVWIGHLIVGALNSRIGTRAVRPGQRKRRRATRPSVGLPAWSTMALAVAASLTGDDALSRLHCNSAGLSQAEATARLARDRSQRVAQPRCPAAGGDGAPAAQSTADLASCSGADLICGRRAHGRADHPGDHRAERRARLLQRVPLGAGGRGAALTVAPHRVGMRDGKPTAVDVTELVPGDVVRLSVGDVVPADLRLLQADGLECDEAVLTGESLAGGEGQSIR